MLSMNVPESVVQDIVKQHISTEVIKGMLGKEALIEKLVDGILKMKVDSEGRVSAYSDARPYIDKLIADEIRTAAKDAIQEYVKDQKGAIAKEVEKQLKKHTSTLVKAFMDTITETTKKDYYLRVSVDGVQKS